jgi:hypothetical protein
MEIARALGCSVQELHATEDLQLIERVRMKLMVEQKTQVGAYHRSIGDETIH